MWLDEKWSEMVTIETFNTESTTFELFKTFQRSVRVHAAEEN